MKSITISIANLIFVFGLALISCGSPADEGEVRGATQPTETELMTTEPTFPGGQEGLQAYLKKNLNYPEACREEGIEGVVNVDFMVNADGTVTDVKTTGEADTRLKKEALRVVAMMPAWTPGAVNDSAVAVPFNLPVRFELPASKE